MDVEHAVDGRDDHAEVGQGVPELGDVEAHLKLVPALVRIRSSTHLGF